MWMCSVASRMSTLFVPSHGRLLCSTLTIDTFQQGNGYKLPLNLPPNLPHMRHIFRLTMQWTSFCSCANCYASAICLTGVHHVDVKVLPDCPFPPYVV